MARFFKFTPELARFLREKLSHSEWKLWSYFVTLDPFGEKYVEAPPTLTILSECNISKATYYRSIAKFQDLELFDFQDKGFNFRNLRGLTNDKNEGVSRVRQESHECDKNLTDEKNSLTDENLSIYKEVQILSDLPEAESEFSEIPDPEPAIAVGVVTEINQTSPTDPISLGEDKFSEARTVSVQGKNVQQRNFNWLPDGPWNLEGKLDANFRDWLANKWVTDYGKDIHTQRANVLSHFKKDPDNLIIRWEQYQGQIGDRTKNEQIVRSETGHTFKVFKAEDTDESDRITPEQWEETRKKLAALTGNPNFGRK
jgi:hypothetical protein